MKDILGIIKSLGRGASIMELSSLTGISEKELAPVLNDHLSAFELVKIKDKYALPKQMGLFVGKLSINQRGFGFLLQDDEDIFISADDLGYALDGDIVAVRLRNRSNGHSKEGYVADIICRAIDTVVGTVAVINGEYRLIPKDKRLQYKIIIDSTGDAVEGDIVSAHILRYPSKRSKFIVDVVKILGTEGDHKIDIDCVVAEMGIPDEFSKESLKQAKGISSSITDISSRADFRDELVITIDGDDSKDFDDAVSLLKTENGYMLKVHIADVSHYVKYGTALDKDAYKRGNSVYFPGSVIPMLPEELSNDVCSLVENKDRLTLSCVMEIDENGVVRGEEIVKSVIKSKHRMTYSKVNAILKGNKALCKEYADIVPMLFDMNRLKYILFKNRIKMGSLEFNIPETGFKIENGEVTDVFPKTRGESEQLIEEFMLLANKTVCKYMINSGLPCVYRVHEPPAKDKMDTFTGFVSSFGYSIKKPTPKKLQQLLDDVKDTEIEPAVNTLLLRTLQKARYSPTNLHHFGLAFHDYCHFTSPIRRYADLVVHRIISDHLIGKGSDMSNLNAICAHISETEKTAMDAEMKIDDLYKCKFMHNHLGEEYEGVISGMNGYGFYVMLKNTCEGMVRLADLKDDYYIYDEKLFRIVGEHTGRAFKIGDKARVIISSVNEELCRIDMVLL